MNIQGKLASSLNWMFLLVENPLYSLSPLKHEPLLNSHSDHSHSNLLKASLAFLEMGEKDQGQWDQGPHLAEWSKWEVAGHCGAAVLEMEQPTVHSSQIDTTIRLT